MLMRGYFGFVRQSHLSSKKGKVSMIITSKLLMKNHIDFYRTTFMLQGFINCVFLNVQSTFVATTEIMQGLLNMLKKGICRNSENVTKKIKIY